MQQKQGFPKLSTPLRIVNKLNNMVLTLSQGWHDTKMDAVIIQKPLHTQKQKFKISEKDSLKVYYIEPLNRDVVLQTKSGWGDMVYSQVYVGKYDKSTNQLWRIVAYDEVIYNEKKQTKSIFEYKQLTQAIVESTDLKGLAGKDSLGSGHEPIIKEVKVSQKTSEVSTIVYKLGYEFESGPTINTITEVKSSSVTVQTSQQVPKSNQEQQFDIGNPPRFPIKQKNNLPAIDLDTKGWFFIENVKFNMVLQIEAGIDEPGMSIVLNRLNGNRNQLWRFE